MKILKHIEAFFFAPITARGFSLMRVSWAFVTLLFLLFEWSDVSYYYSNAGLFPLELQPYYTRSYAIFSVLHWVQHPAAVFCLYLFLLITLFCAMIGLRTRLMLVISVLLLFSFHERSPSILGGGDTLLRNIGFILMLSPGVGGFSIDRYRTQWASWKKHRTFLPPLLMPMWPWRLLLWQMIVLYGTSLWYKLLGTMWIRGTAVEATFHHPVYARLPEHMVNLMLPMLSIGDYFALLWHSTWLLLLVPKPLTDLLPGPKIPLRRLIIIGGIFFHGGILVMMDAGVFSLAIFSAYLGLLRESDIAWLKKIFGKKKNQIVVLHDGHCGLCLRSIFTLQLFDWLKRLAYADFRDASERKKHAPDLSEEELDKSMHIRLPNGTYQKGFDAFRAMAWHLPPLWPAVPLLYVPGVPLIGRRIYAKIAASRKKCDHEGCRI